MPIKYPDPFSYSTDGLSDQVNPYLAALREANTDGGLPLVFGQALVPYPGQWRELAAAYHQRREPYKKLVLEIGCHQGRTLLEMAVAHPDILFIGMDITFKRVVTTAQRAKAKGLNNVFVVLANAVALGQLFAAGELDGCLIFFPDPWIKKARQAKNRLVDETFARQLSGVLVTGGFCWLKTDHLEYFENSVEQLDGVGLVRVDTPTPPLLGKNFTSTFEQRFHQKGLETYAGQWVRMAGAQGHLL